MNDTSQTIDEAIFRALMVGRLSHAHSRAVSAVRNFLAQHFQTAIMKAELAEDAATVQALKELFERVTEKDPRT